MFEKKFNKMLSEAIKVNDVAKMVEALEKGADINYVVSPSDTRNKLHVLSYAVEYNSLDCLKILLERGSDYRDGELTGKSALYLAASKLNPKAIEYLANAGANINAKSTSGKTALMSIIDRVANLRYSQKSHRYNPKISDTIETIIYSGAHVNAVDKAGQTALMQASRAGLIEIVETLMDAHARTEIKDHEGNTALILTAASYANKDEKMACLTKLINGQANVNARNNKNETALYKSTFSPYPLFFKALVSAGANTDALSEKEQVAYNILYIEKELKFTEEELALYAVANDHIVVKMDKGGTLSQTFNFSKRTVTEINNGQSTSEDTFDDWKGNASSIFAAYKVIQRNTPKVAHPFPHPYRRTR